MGYRRPLEEWFFIFLWQAHISFLVDIIIQQLIRYGCNGDSCFINIRILEQKIECCRTAAAPAMHRYATGVNKGPLRYSFSGHCLVPDIENADILVNRFAPCCTFWHRCSAAIEADLYITVSGNITGI